ncbi:hypothetical protein AB0M36_16780 [Actinoplanes sp. NPDC051346]|uniref:hypothetical protein n=1 Tax=Actinoplanes sp. NPDC051346 TaxID=3155048 RepID=UPI00343BB26B
MAKNVGQPRLAARLRSAISPAALTAAGFATAAGASLLFGEDTSIGSLARRSRPAVSTTQGRPPPL